MYTTLGHKLGISAPAFFRLTLRSPFASWQEDCVGLHALSDEKIQGINSKFMAECGIIHYNLDLFLAVDYRTCSPRGVQFRQKKKAGDFTRPYHFGGGENRTGMVGRLFSIDKSNRILHQITQILRTRRGETGTKFSNCFLFSIKVRQKALVSKHLYDAPKQVVITKTDDVIFEADALKHFLVHKPLDLSG